MNEDVYVFAEIDGLRLDLIRQKRLNLTHEFNMLAAKLEREYSDIENRLFREWGVTPVPNTFEIDTEKHEIRRMKQVT